MRMSALPLKAFIDPNFMDWLPTGLPPRLERDLISEYGPNWPHLFNLRVKDLFGRGLEEGRYQTRLSEIMVGTHDPRNAYHNMHHCHRVGECSDCALRLLEWLMGELPREFTQAATFGYVPHDLKHPGSTFFIDAPADRIPADVDPHTTTVEFYTACAVDQAMWGWGFSTLARLVSAGIIIASTYGAMAEHGKRLGVHRVRPKAILTTLMRAADVATPHELTTSVHGETGILFQETPALSPPISWRGYLKDRRGFLGYVKQCFNEFDTAIWAWLTPWQKLRLQAVGLGSASITRKLGWRATLAFNLQNLDLIEQGKHTMYAAIIRSRLAVLGVPLD